MSPSSCRHCTTIPGLVKGSGLSLVELILATALSSLLAIALVQVALAARQGFRLQEGLAELQENARHFADLLAVTIADSGYHPRPWLHEPTPVGLMADSAEASAPYSDRVVSRSWSDRNCFGSQNPALDHTGNPEFYLKESSIELANGSLSISCRYGPAGDALATQVNRQGVIPQVEAFQAQYAQDDDGDGIVDRWVRAGEWESPAQLLAVRLGILSSSRERIAMPETRSFRILDFNFQAAADGKLRRVTSYTLPLQPAHP